MIKSLIQSDDSHSIKLENDSTQSLSGTIKNILNNYSSENNPKNGFLELCCSVLDQINDSTSGRFYLMSSPIRVPTNAQSNDSLCRDLFAKCKILINFRMILLLLQKNEGEDLKNVFQYQDLLWKKFQNKLKNCLSNFEIKEKIQQFKSILDKMLLKENDWSSWKANKCEGNIYTTNIIDPSKFENKFSKLEEESVNIKIKTSNEENKTRKHIFKRTHEKTELEKMKNWISLRQNNDLLSNLETEDLWIDRGNIHMSFEVMANECLKGSELANIKSEIEEYERTMTQRQDIDEYVKWRFTNRLVKRSFETMVSDHEKDICSFLNNNINCFKNKTINQKILAMRYSKQGLLLKQRNQLLSQNISRIKGNDKGISQGITKYKILISYLLTWMKIMKWRRRRI